MPGSFRLGLTGGIGSGKSTVAKFLCELGAAVIDADEISRSVTAPSGAAIAPIVSEFGIAYIDSAGALDRDKMRLLAYADASARKRLEAIVHPLVGLEIERQSEEASSSGRQCTVFDIPLLVESPHWRQRVHKVLVVDCLPETQIERVKVRSGLTRAEIETIMASQAPRHVRLRAADLVIFNDQIDLAQLHGLVGQIWRRLRLSFR
jgi:dephospho-CoA kinase